MANDLKVGIPARPHGVTSLPSRGGVGYDTGQLRWKRTVSMPASLSRRHVRTG